MADTAIDLAAPLPFSNLDDLLLPLLLGTGARGAAAIRSLLDTPDVTLGHHLGSKELDTPAGRLRVSLFNTNGFRSLSIALTMRAGMGCIHGEVYSQGVVLPAALCIAAAGRPLSEICETPEAFPGRDAVIQRARTLTSSTRILVTHTDATVSLHDLSPTARWSQGCVEDPSRHRAPRKKKEVA